MWLLRRDQSDGIVLYMTTRKDTYVVGRREGDLILENDPSISRLHCSIHIAPANRCPFTVKTTTGVWLVDKSKYGIFLRNGSDWSQAKSGDNVQLNNGVVIRFGLSDNIYRLEFKPVIMVTSMISNQMKQELKEKLNIINGVLLNNWDDKCNLVVVNQLTLTIKVVLALIKCIPIVTPDYVDQVVASIQNNSEWPKHEDYKPVIAESTLKPDLILLYKDRKDLFKNLVFHIPTKAQFNGLSTVIQAAGGKAKLLEPNIQMDMFLDDKIIVLNYTLNKTSQSNSSVPDSFSSIRDFLKQHNRRVVPESEIAQAIAYSSTETYCNPKFLKFTVRKSDKISTSKGREVEGCTPTEKLQDNLDDGICQIIPASATQESSSGSVINPQTKKRARSPFGIEVQISKKSALESPQPIVFEEVNVKRSHSDLFSSSSQSSETSGRPEKPQMNSVNTADNYMNQTTAEDSKFDLSTFQSKQDDENLDPFWKNPPATSTQRKRKAEENVNDLFGTTSKNINKRSNVTVHTGLQNKSGEQRESSPFHDTDLDVYVPRDLGTAKALTNTKSSFYYGFHHSTIKTEDNFSDFICVDKEKSKIKKCEDDEEEPVILLSLVKMRLDESKDITKSNRLFNIKPFRKKALKARGIASVNPNTTKVISVHDMYIVQCGRNGEVNRLEDSEEDKDDSDDIDMPVIPQRARKRDDNPFANL